MVNEVLTSVSSATLTNRLIYRSLCAFPEPKIIQENANIDFAVVWRRLYGPAVPYGNRDILLRLIHNKLPVQERLCRIGLSNDPFCLFCTGQIVADRVHFFCGCVRVHVCWSWLRLLVTQQCQTMSQSSDWELLNLAYPNNTHANEISWLLSHYVEYAWNHFLHNDTELDRKKLFGFLSFKYKCSSTDIGNIFGLD